MTGHDGDMSGRPLADRARPRRGAAVPPARSRPAASAYRSRSSRSRSPASCSACCSAGGPTRTSVRSAPSMSVCAVAAAAAPRSSSRRSARCTLDSHDGPVHLQVRLGALDQGRTEALIDDPAGITRASRTAVEDVRAGVVRLGAAYPRRCRCWAPCSCRALVFRDVRRVAVGGGLALVIAAGSIGVAAGTLRPRLDRGAALRGPAGQRARRRRRRAADRRRLRASTPTSCSAWSPTSAGSTPRCPRCRSTSPPRTARASCTSPTCTSTRRRGR